MELLSQSQISRQKEAEDRVERGSQYIRETAQDLSHTPILVHFAPLEIETWESNLEHQDSCPREESEVVSKMLNQCRADPNNRIYRAP